MTVSLWSLWKMSLWRIRLCEFVEDEYMGEFVD
jgi:hypothetical protein